MSLKFSIITPSLNQGIYIEDTIRSVCNQNYNDYEHIIIDGGSSDDTHKIVQKYDHLKFISGKDRGPADAINKGFSLAGGDIFAWINSDDYYEKNIFGEVENIFESNRDAGIVIGDLTIIDAENKIKLIDKTHRYTKEYLVHINADVIRQPCTFFRKSLFLKTGGLNINYKLAFDYDIFIKMFEHSRAIFTGRNYAFYREHDKTLTRKYLRKQALEIRKISSSYGAKITDPIFRTLFKKMIFPDRLSFIR